VPIPADQKVVLAALILVLIGIWPHFGHIIGRMASGALAEPANPLLLGLRLSESSGLFGGRPRHAGRAMSDA
jgi:hypothetical protein